VKGLFQIRILAPLLACAAAATGWFWLPGSAPDRAVFAGCARAFANPPFFMTGRGTHPDPWQLRTVVREPRIDPQRVPRIVSLGDDAEGFFQSRPPSPVDLAVILANLRRLGVEDLAVAAVPAWDEPERIGLAAWEKALGRFRSCVMAVPLGRGAVAEPIPQAMQRASIPLAAVHGDITALPAVNRVSPGSVIHGGDNTTAGFQILDSEPSSALPPMLARWDDRVVFAFPLLAAMQELGLPAGGIEIRLGEYLRTGPGGPVVPIDRHGRMTALPGQINAESVVDAKWLIDGGAELFPMPAARPVILRDDRGTVDPATRGFSSGLATIIATITSDAARSPARDFGRLGVLTEVILLALMVGLVALACRLPAFAGGIAFLVLAGLCASAQIIAAACSVWLPGLAALTAVAAAFAVFMIGHMLRPAT
jgi:hypothetical protein